MPGMVHGLFWLHRLLHPQITSHLLLLLWGGREYAKSYFIYTSKVYGRFAIRFSKVTKYLSIICLKFGFGVFCSWNTWEGRPSLSHMVKRWFLSWWLYPLCSRKEVEALRYTDTICVKQLWVWKSPCGVALLILSPPGHCAYVPVTLEQSW